MSLRRLLVLSVSLTLLLCVGGILWLAHILQSQEVEQQSAMRMRTVAEHAERRIQVSLQERFYELNFLSNTIGRNALKASPDAAKSLQALFDQMLKEYEGYAWIGLADRQGRVIVASNGQLQGESLAQLHAFRQGLNGPYVGDVHRAEKLGGLLPPDEDGRPRLLLDLALPVRHDGSVQAVLTGHLNWFWLDGLLKEYELQTQQGVQREILLLDQNRQVVRGPQALLGSQFTDLPAGTASNPPPRYWATTDWLSIAIKLQGNPKLALPEWTLVVRENHHDLMSMSSQMPRALLAASLPLLALFLAVVALLGRYIATPLEKISRAAASGCEIPEVSTYREARQLQENLQRMTTALKAQHAQVEAEVETRMAEMNQLLKALNMHTLVTMADSKGNITYVNDLFCKVSGYSREEALGQNHRVVKSDYHSADFYRDMWSTIRAGKIWSGLICNRKKNGELYWVKSVIAPADPNYQSKHAFVSVRTDITEQIETQQTLQRLSNDLLRRGSLMTLLNNVTSTANEAFDRQDAILRCLADICAFMHWKIAHAYVVDPNDHSILRSSRQWYTTDAQRYQAFRDQTEALEYRIGMGLPGRVLAQRRPVLVTSESWNAPGFPRYQAVAEAGFTSALGIPVTSGEDILGVVEFFGDTVQEVDAELLDTLHNVGVQLGFVFKRHEDAITLQQAMDAAQKANRAKTDFLSSMSHELRTPLNAILGFAQILANSSRYPLNEKQAGQVGHILRSGEYLLDLINEVLDLSRIESGRLSMSIEKASLGEIMADCMAKVAPLAEQAGITMETQCELDACNALVKVDRVRLQQILLNLLSNAIKYNRPQGSVHVHSALAADGYILVTIRDTGRGIPLERQAEVFLPFNRLGAENSEIQGTGIGLTITKQLIQAMHGDIGFHSTPEVGSAFWIKIPLAGMEKEIPQDPAAPPAIPLAATPAAADDREKVLDILCVEDNPSNIQLMQDIFDKRPGYSLRIARSCDEAFVLLQQGKSDIILMDINLPGMSGIEGTRILKANAETRHIPVIALSADAMEATRAQALEAGVVEYLTKPVKVDLLLATLERFNHGPAT